MISRWALLALLLTLAAQAETLDDTVRALAKKIAPRLTANELPRITHRNLSSLGNAESQRARAIFEQALRRRTPRNAQPIDITLTISENLRGYLLIAQIGRTVEMVPYRPAASTPHSTLALQKRLLWEQDDPLLDLAVLDDSLIALDTSKLSVYRFASGRYEPVASRPVPAPALRDPRGRLEIDGNTLAIHLPGAGCRGTWKPDLDFTCQPESSAFPLAGESVRFTPARNTLDSNSWPPLFSLAAVQESGKPLYLIASADGRVQLYDSNRRPVAAFDGWGSDLVSVSNGCDPGRFVLATRASDAESSDAVSVFEIADRRPLDTNESAEFPGVITALWPAPAGATVITRDPATQRYAAYTLTVDCRR